MAGSIKPIRSESARFLVGGTRKGQGVVLLYPDKLVSVRMQAELWGCFVGAIAMAAATHPLHITPVLADAITGALGVWLGGATGRAVDRGLAAKAVADGPPHAAVIPLDMVASMATLRSAWFGGRLSSETLVVTTADGTQYGFRGRTGSLQGAIASALAGLGREVRATTAGPWSRAGRLRASRGSRRWRGTCPRPRRRCG
jgi:hypothetical protein